MSQGKHSPRNTRGDPYKVDIEGQMKTADEVSKIKSESEFTPRSKSPLSGTEIGPSRKLGPSTEVQVQPKNNQSTDNQSTDNQSTVGNQGKFIENHQPGYAPGKRIFHTRRSEKPPSTTGNPSKLSRIAMDNNNTDFTTNNTDFTTNNTGLGVNATKATLNPRDAASTHNELDKKVENPRKQRHSTLRSNRVNPIGGKRKTRKNKKKKK